MRYVKKGNLTHVNKFAKVLTKVFMNMYAQTLDTDLDTSYTANGPLSVLRYCTRMYCTHRAQSTKNALTELNFYVLFYGTNCL